MKEYNFSGGETTVRRYVASVKRNPELKNSEVFVPRVVVYSGEKRIVVHGRTFGNNHRILDADHYLELLRERPGAFRDARPLSEWKKTWSGSLNTLLERFCERQGENRGIKEFIDVLLLVRTYGQKRVEEAAEQCLESGLSNVAGILHILESAVAGRNDPSSRVRATDRSSRSGRIGLFRSGSRPMNTAFLLQLHENLKSLTLGNAARHLEECLRQAAERESSYEVFLLEGDTSFFKERGELLFQVFAEWHERGSVIVTTNLGFGSWTEVFGDANTTTAPLDRLTHKAFILECSWENYRLNETLRGRKEKYYSKEQPRKKWQRRSKFGCPWRSVMR